MPVISVIVATHKRLEYLKITIASILAQSNADLEVVIVADGHDPAVEHYVNKKGDSRVNYYYVDHCGYPAKARNFGISKSTGEYIAFCDDDDLWMPEKLALQLEKIRQEQADLCFTNRIVIDDTGNTIKQKQVKWVPKSTPSLFTLLLSNYITYSSVMVHRTALYNTGGFIDNIKFKSVEDHRLWLLLISKGIKLTYLKQKLTFYRVHPNNISQKPSKGQRLTRKVIKEICKEAKVPLHQQFYALTLSNLKYIVYKSMGK